MNGEVEAWGAGLSLLHVPSGLFVQGHYMAADFSGTGSTAYWGQVANVGVTGGQKSDATQWLIQAGITKNWFGFGNTALYAEYSPEQRLGCRQSANLDSEQLPVPSPPSPVLWR